MAKTYTEEEKIEVFERVLESMRNGMSCIKACRANGIPKTTLMQWVDARPEWQVQYTCAREELLDYWASETLDISDAPVGCTDNGATDSGMVSKQKLQVDTRKWLLSKLAPKKYGDRQIVSGNLDVNATYQPATHLIVDPVDVDAYKAGKLRNKNDDEYIET